MNSEISGKIAAIATNAEMATAILAIYQQGYVDGAKAKDEVLALTPAVNLEVFDLPIEDIDDLSIRAYNVLKRAGVNTLFHITQMSESDLMGLSYFKMVDVEDIKTKLADYGLSLKAPAQELTPDINPEDTPIEDFDLRIRAYNVLKGAGVNTLSDIAQMTESDLTGLPRLQKIDVEDIKTKLAPYNLSLKEMSPDA